jgi:phospholipase C
MRGRSRLMRAICALAVLLNSGQALAMSKPRQPATATPIKHVVVIFQENVSFDHYFATYPKATNPNGEPKFVALAGTPPVNGLTQGLLSSNPNFLNQTNNNSGMNSVPANPFRLDRSQAFTADQDHDYTPEQMAFDHGLMDLFPLSVGTAGPPPDAPPAAVETTALTMGYYDGNTVTALWNYAQFFAMSDNSYDTNFGPSTPGALNLISGQTNGAINNIGGTGSLVDDGYGGLTVISDSDPLDDVCSTSTGERFQMSGKNIGDLLNAANISWGFFQGGFDLSTTNSNGTTGCNRSTTSAISNVMKADYIPHHQPFQYYVSTANPTHIRPTSVMTIGQSGDAGNHQYDIDDFYAAVQAGNFPAVSFLKAPGYQDGHAGYSDPLDEQAFVVKVLNFLAVQPQWRSTLVIIAYDDSDGWYDHQMGPIMNQSTTSADALSGPGACGSGLASALPGVADGTLHAQGRCGYGPRLPFMVLSPYARRNFVDHTTTDLSSIIRFIEDNWLAGERIGQGSFDSIAGPITNMLNFNRNPDADNAIFLDPDTGKVVH